MNEITVTMAIVDFIPVILFFISAVILQRDLYNKMVKGAFALLATGSIMVLVGGIYKALWKILYALNICDYPVMQGAFFPFQATGFVLTFIALLGMFTKHNKPKLHMMGVAVVPVYNSNIPFVIGQTVGCAGVQWCMFAIARKMKKPVSAILFALSFIFMLGMGYLSAKFDNSSSMHWIAQIVNICSWATFLGGVIILHKAGLGRKGVLKIKNGR